MERSLLCLLFQESEFYSKSNKVESVGSSLFSWLAFWLYFLVRAFMWGDMKFTQQMHFLLSWPRRGGEGVPGPPEGGGRGLRATPSLYHSCPGHMEGFIYFFFGGGAVSAKVPWVLGKCFPEMQKIIVPVIRELLGKCWDEALCSQHHTALWYAADVDCMAYHGIGF